jgi:hypothetical protein
MYGFKIYHGTENIQTENNEINDVAIYTYSTRGTEHKKKELGMDVLLFLEVTCFS